MKICQSFVIISALLLSQSSMAAIYKCKTHEGITFSQIPCATNAEKVTNIKSKPTRKPGGTASETTSSSQNKQSQSNQTQLVNFNPSGGGKSFDVSLLDGLDAYKAEDILKKVGPPAARYVRYGTDHWLYPNGVKEEDGRRLCPEVLLENNVKFQITWYPEDVMIKNVAAAKRFAGWLPSGAITQKSFYMVETDLRGMNKSAIVNKYGEPDAKKAYNGVEMWEYAKVPYSKSKPTNHTLFISFDGDNVSNVIGN